MARSNDKPGDLVAVPGFGIAMVVRNLGHGYIEILCNDGTLKTVFYDAVEAVEPVQAASAVV